MFESLFPLNCSSIDFDFEKEHFDKREIKIKFIYRYHRDRRR